MPNKISTVDYDYFETVCHENIELPIDIDYAMPDYCPDVKKILKCNPTVDISAYSFTQDRMMCEGKLVLHIEYIDENSDTIRICDIAKDFSHSKELKSYEGKTIGKLKASVGHIICRAVSARKLDIHLPVILNMCIVIQKKNKLNCDCQNLEIKTETQTISHAINAINHTFSVEEELQLPQSSMPIDCVIRKSITLKDIKCILQNDKIQLDALADIGIVYRSFSENSTVERISYNVPFSQVIDTNYVNSECISNTELNVCEFSIQAKEDSTGEYTICDLYLKICASIFAYQNKEIEIIVDAYSSKNHCKMHYGEINLSKYEGEHQEKMNLTKSVFLSDDEVEKVIDYWCEEVSVNTYYENNKINYRGKFNICIIFKGKSGMVFSVTKTFDFTKSREFSELCGRKCEASVKMELKNFRIIDGNNLEFNCDLVIFSNDFTSLSKNVLNNCEYIDDEEIVNEKIRVYYSQKGEKLWDIGKKYLSPVEEIIANNKLTDEKISTGSALIIY
ncbi:MAG: DUF3794 domain-containing protein [Clostridia bacterium]